MRSRVFFVRHGLIGHGGITGRYPFDVTGQTLHRESDRRRLLKQFKGQVYADGFGHNLRGTSVDPHVLSDLIPWFHSYWLVDKGSRRQLVAPAGRLLSEVVRPGDVLVYGCPLSTHLVAIDTVITVGCTVALPQQDGRFAIPEGLEGLLAELGAGVKAEAFRRSRSYTMNLADAAPGGRRSRARIPVHRIICGTDRVESGDVADSGELLREFLDGQGFNFIPLADEQESGNASVAERPGLFVRIFPDAWELHRSNITKLDRRKSERLLRLMLEEADDLVIGRLKPTRPVRQP